MPLRRCPIHLLFNSEEGYGCQVCLNPQFLSHCDDEPVDIEWVYRHEEGMPYSICCQAEFRCGENTHTRAGTCTNTCHPPEGEPGEDDDDDDDDDEPEDGDKCGPDVTRALAKMVGDIERTFVHAKRHTRSSACTKPFALTYEAAIAGFDTALWSADPLELLPAGQGAGCAMGQDCRRTVQVQGGCYSARGVNYVMWGIMGRLCHKAEEDLLDKVFWWLGFRGNPTLLLEATLWTALGFRGWPRSVRPLMYWRECAPECAAAVPDDVLLGGWRWLGLNY